MNDWRDTTIGALGRVVTGSTPPSKHPDWFGDDLPFVTPSDITFGDRRPRPERWLSPSGRDGLRTRLVPPGSSAFVCIGATIGKVCLVETEALTNQQINTVIPGPATDCRFIYSLLRHIAPAVAQMASGAATPIISKSAFSAIPVRIPDLETQVRIGEVLGALDDLIENNQRRVELLEEMARAIYREWFVKFRYPGQEDVPMVDSTLGLIPEGWEVSTLSDVSYITAGQSPKSEFYNEDGNGKPFHQGVADFGRHFPRTRKWCSVDGRSAREGDVLVSVRAPVGRLNIAGTDITIGRGLAAVRAKDGRQALLLGHLRQAFAEEDSMGNDGAIFKSLSKAELSSVPVLVPPESVADAANDVFEDNLSMIRTLSHSTQNLSEVRDQLLPKLVTGEIDVSTIDLDVLIATRSIDEGAVV